MSRMTMKQFSFLSRPLYKLNTSLALASNATFAYRTLPTAIFSRYASNLDSIYNEYNSNVSKNNRDRRSKPVNQSGQQPPRRKKKEVQLSDQHRSLADYVEENKSGSEARRQQTGETTKPSKKKDKAKFRPNSSKKSNRNIGQELKPKGRINGEQTTTHIDWDTRTRESDEADTLDPNERFFERLSEWENGRVVSRPKKSEVKLPPVSAIDNSFTGSQDTKSKTSRIPGTYHINPEEIQLVAVTPSQNQPPVPYLHHDLDRVLFSPGVHVLKDERTNVYNFPTELETIMSIRDFDFSNVPAFVPSSQDKALSQLAFEQSKTFTASTSSLTSVLTQLHFLLSRNRLPSGQMLSGHFRGRSVDFAYSAKKPVSMFLRWHPETKTYSLDSDKTQDEEIILSLLGQVLEAKLTTSNEEFESFAKPSGQNKTMEEKERPSSTYHYSACGDFLMRSQIDCYDPRLPGTGVFDLKTRAVCAVRHDIDYAQIRDGSDYQIKKFQGSYESYEREMFDLIRTTMFKYSLQARIGRMDGIFVAYHNIRKMFGFEYLPLTEIDKIYHLSGFKFDSDTDSAMIEAQAPIIADQEFRMSINILSQILKHTISIFPEQSVNIAFKAPASPAELERFDHKMVILVNPMPEETIDRLQKGIPLDDISEENLDTRIRNAKGRKLYKKAKKAKARRYLDRHTLFQVCEDQYYGELSRCVGWNIHVDNFIDSMKLPLAESPTPMPGQKWTASLKMMPIPFAKLPIYLQNMCFSSLNNSSKPTESSLKSISSSIVAVAEDLQAGPPKKNGRLVSRPDTMRRSQEEIANLVEQQLALLGKPSEMQKVLRAYDEKGRQAELEYKELHGHKEKIVWNSGTTTNKVMK